MYNLQKCKCKRTQKTTRELVIFPEQKKWAVCRLLSIQTCLGHETNFNTENSFHVTLGIHSVCLPLNAISKSFQKVSSHHSHTKGLTDESGLHCKMAMAHFTYLAWPQSPHFSWLLLSMLWGKRETRRDRLWTRYGFAPILQRRAFLLCSSGSTRRFGRPELYMTGTVKGEDTRSHPTNVSDWCISGHDRHGCRKETCFWTEHHYHPTREIRSALAGFVVLREICLAAVQCINPF